MSMNDSIADLITRIRNAQRVKKATVNCHSSRLGDALLEVLKDEGYIRGYKATEVRPGVVETLVELKYFEGAPAIQEISRTSKPGRRSYTSIKGLNRFRNGLGILIMSTSKGVLSDWKAAELNVGGEVLCHVF
ncbi:MAG: 30S ribosomal protein S8 [Alphaproteobacteria bacterium]